jgi:2'-5' RNA ligase
MCGLTGVAERAPTVHSVCVVRRQVVAFLPTPVGKRIDEIRARWDPTMAQRIAAHITLVHDAPDDNSLRSCLDVVATGPQLLVQLTAARCWGAPEHGIYLGVEDTRGDINRIRKSLRVIDPAGVRYEPHVTLVHSRAAAPASLAEAWSRLADWTLETAVAIDSLCVIELHATKWAVVTRVAFSGDHA